MRRLHSLAFAVLFCGLVALTVRSAAAAEPGPATAPEDGAKQSEVTNNHVSRLQLPPKGPVLSAFFNSSVGLVVLLLLYAANLYAGLEIAVFRRRSVALGCSLAALLPVIGPIILLSIPARVRERGRAEAEAETVEPTPPPPTTAPATAAPIKPGGAVLARAQAAAPAASAPKPEVFQRGQVTFNRRFFETRFPEFFGVVRRDAGKDMVLLIRTPRGWFTVSRITRITANDMHVEIREASASQEVMLPFVEIQEIQFKHKDA